ncbi:MAG: hypothetical protein HYR76_00535 [Ignavibacteria bacterium]|nr:hypothetical protein [Ignavibacteria bacterium]
MKITPLFTVLVVLVYGCNNRVEQLESQNATLQDNNRQLSQDLAVRDEYVDKVTDAINDVYTSIEEVKASESSLLKETNKLESERKLTHEEMRAKLIDRIDVIRATLRNNHQRLKDLQSNLSTSTKHYAGLKKMVDNLKKTLEERDRSIADLGKRVEGLQQEVNEKSTMITQKDSVINTQYQQITTTYYIAGTRDELEKKGIITKEGGFLWGLLGSTTTLASSFDERLFKPINKTLHNTIQVDGKIDEVLPKRSEQFYQKAELSSNQSMLTIAEPDQFWKDKYLVIITDRPNTNLFP